MELFTLLSAAVAAAAAVDYPLTPGCHQINSPAHHLMLATANVQ